MIDLNELQAAIDRCAFDGDVIGISKTECASLLSMLKEVEKDAARYRWLLDVGRHEYDVDDFFDGSSDSAEGRIDEAMQCK